MLQNPGTIGVLLPNIEGRLVDENGRDVPIGSPGELWLRGPNIAKYDLDILSVAPEIDILR